MTIHEEQRAFEVQLDDLLGEHAGEYVLFKDGLALEFFPSFEQAYCAGVARFGHAETFLVELVAKMAPMTTSITWEAAAL